MPVDVFSARDSQCRFVVSPGFFCGDAAVASGSWCAVHRRAVYVPSKKRAAEIHRLNSIANGASRRAPQSIPNGW